MFASNNLALPLIFFNFLLIVKSPKNFTICENCPADQLKAKKNRGYRHGFLAFCYFVFSSSISNLVIKIFLLTGTSKDTNMFNGPANLEILPKEKK